MTCYIASQHILHHRLGDRGNEILVIHKLRELLRYILYAVEQNLLVRGVKPNVIGVVCRVVIRLVAQAKSNKFCLCFCCHVIKSIKVIKVIKVIKIYSTFCISHTTRTNGLLYFTGHNECPLLTILLT